MKENYRIRMMAARDPRFAKIAARLGYGTRDMVAEREEPVDPAPEPVNTAAAAAPPEPAPAPDPEPAPEPEPVRRAIPDALDHDEDGRKGGSKAGEASTRARGRSRSAMAAEFERLTGEKPDGRWSKDTLEQELGKVRGRQ